MFLKINKYLNNFNIHRKKNFLNSKKFYQNFQKNGENFKDFYKYYNEDFLKKNTIDQKKPNYPMVDNLYKIYNKSFKDVSNFEKIADFLNSINILNKLKILNAIELLSKIFRYTNTHKSRIFFEALFIIIVFIYLFKKGTFY